MEFPLCPACAIDVEIDELDIDRGEKIGCPECGVTLTVVQTCPIELDIADEEIAEWQDH